MREVTIPSVGMAMTEAVLNAWLKHPGDSVAVGEAIAEVETDKSSLDLESPSDGVLGRHLVSAGASVPVGQVIVRVLEPGEIEPHDNDGPHAGLRRLPTRGGASGDRDEAGGPHLATAMRRCEPDRGPGPAQPLAT